jgi:peroxiredoxin
LREKVSDFEKLGAHLLVVDARESWSAIHFLKGVELESGEIGYPLLMVPALTASASYGVATQMKIHVELSNHPATFIIDREGVSRGQRPHELLRPPVKVPQTPRQVTPVRVRDNPCRSPERTSRLS